MESTLQPQAAKPSAPRALALDALRGWAIITMCLSGVVPWGGLPSWMYHAQYVNQQRADGGFTLKFDGTNPGFSWVDWVFPLFLFSMGVAFPFALKSRLNKGVPLWRIVAGIFGRGAALVFFAIYVQHIAPFTITGSPDAMVLAQALLGFLLLFLVYTRLPDRIPAAGQWAIRAVGLAGAIGLLAVLEYPAKSPHGTGFSVYRNDIIILVLANMAVWGSMIWLATRGNVMARLGAMALVFAALQADKIGGSWVNWLATPRLPAAWAEWTQANLGFKDFSWAYQFGFTKYLMIVIPGTIIGELLMDWMAKSDREGDHGRGTLPIGLLSVGCMAVILFAHIGLQARWTTLTPLLVIPALFVGWRLISRFPVTVKTDRLLRGLYGWGAFWLALGLVLEPFEGGIKKDPSTLSYYFVSTGLSILFLLALTIWIDLYGKAKWFWLLISNGQNPMLAYVGIRNLLAPIVHFPLPGIISLEKYFFGLLGSPFDISSGIRYWSMFLWSFVKTIALALVVGLCTRFKLVWRA